MTKPIIVGLDPLREDRAPLNLAAELAHASGAPLIAVACYTHEPFTDAVSGGTLERDLRAHCMERLREAAEGSAELVVAGGTSPAQTLHHVAVERGAGMIVIGSTRKGPVGRLTGGTTAERLLHGAPCPVAVATVGLGADWRARRIGIGFIDSAEGREALRAGAALASEFGCPLSAVTAIEPTFPSASAVVWPYTPGYDPEPARRAAEQSLDDALSAVPASLEASGDAVIANPCTAVVELSRDVDMLVCGSRGYGPIRSVLLGTVTHSLVHTALCPILIVPRGTEQALEELLGRAEVTAP